MTFVTNYSSSTFRAADNKKMLQDGATIITKPIDQVENIVTKTVDTFVPESQDEERKKSHKTAIRVGSTVLVLSIFVAIFNPRFSSKLLEKIKTSSTKAENKAKVDNNLKKIWHKTKYKALECSFNTMQLLSNFNNAKDQGFKYICEKFKLLKKPHDTITKSFDKISKHTVFTKYSKAISSLDKTEKLIEYYKKNLNVEQARQLETKLKEIKTLKEYFSKSNTSYRLKNQEMQMSNLENDVRLKLKNYINEFKTSSNKIEHAKDAYKFWSQDILMPTRDKIEAEGKQAVTSLFGDKKTIRGKYNEILDILTPHLESNELKALEEQLNYSAKKLRDANKSECIEYFDKKRDLILGSAPTDILTAIFGLAASGIAIGTADTKEDKISRSLNGVFPAIAGLGVSTALTAMLFSGGKSIIIASAASSVLSLIGSTANRLLFPKKSNITKEVKNV